VRAGDREAARNILDRLVAVLGRANVFVEVQRHFDRAQERDLERSPLGSREPRKDIVRHAGEQISKAEIGQVGLSLRRPRGHDRERVIERARHAQLPKRGLSDTGLAFEHECGRARV